MDHVDHVNLIRNGVPGSGVWADLGAGSGAFTLALAELLGRQGTIYAVDKDRRVLRRLEQTMAIRFPALLVQTMAANFSKPLNLPLLDGVLMANSLHFLRRKEAALKQIQSYLRPGGRLIIVEYGTDRGNHWVPHPLSYATWESLAGQLGFAETRRLASRPSRFLGQIYAALSVVAES